MPKGGVGRYPTFEFLAVAREFFDMLFANRLTFHYASFGENKFEIGRVVFPLISIKGRGLKCFLPVKSPQSKNFKI